MNRITTALLATLVLIPAGYTFAAHHETDEVRKGIEATNAKFAAALNRGDAAAIAALYTEDATLLPPNSPTVTGPEGIGAFWAATIQAGVTDVVLTTVDVRGESDTAYEIGAYSLKVKLEGQEDITDSGKYVIVWKKRDDGSWKLHVDIWNSDLPLPGQPPEE